MYKSPSNEDQRILNKIEENAKIIKEMYDLILSEKEIVNISDWKYILQEFMVYLQYDLNSIIEKVGMLDPNKNIPYEEILNLIKSSIEKKPNEEIFIENEGEQNDSLFDREIEIGSNKESFSIIGKAKNTERSKGSISNIYKDQFIESRNGSISTISEARKNELNEDLKEFQRRVELWEVWIRQKLRTEDYFMAFCELMEKCKLKVNDYEFDDFSKILGEWLRKSESILIENGQDISNVKGNNTDRKSHHSSISATNIPEIKIVEGAGNEPQLSIQDPMETFANHNSQSNYFEQSNLMQRFNMSPLPLGSPVIDSPAHQCQTMTYEEFLSLIYSWYQKHTPPFLPPDTPKPPAPDLQTKLIETIKEYQKLRNEKISNGEDTSVIDNLIITLREQLKSLQKPYLNKIKKEKSFEELCKIGLHEIFLYYAKQQAMLGKTPTFDDIQKNLETLTLGKFLRFCRDFEFMDAHSLPDKKVLTKEQVQKIFLKNSVLQKEMPETHFLNAIKEISALYYDEEYDKINETDSKAMPKGEKLSKFYEFIGCSDSNLYSKKLKGFLVPFGSGPNTRLPENDIAKKYKPKPRRSPDSRLASTTIRPIERPEKTFREPNIFLTQAATHRAPSDAIVSLTTKATSQNVSYAKRNVAMKARNPFTWQGLGEMTAEQLKDEENFDINELIAEEDGSEDEYLDKKYPLAASQASLKSPEATIKNSNSNFSNKNSADKKRMNKSASTNQISEKTLRRGDELLEITKKEEDEHMKRILKIADAQLLKAQNYAAKIKTSKYIV